MNAPERFELLHAVGEEKLSYENDLKIPHAATFTLQKEDHTLGNIIRMQLLRNERVLFAGYKVPHPLQNYVQVKVQTRESTTPAAEFRDALESLIREVQTLEDSIDSRK